MRAMRLEVFDTNEHHSIFMSMSYFLNILNYHISMFIIKFG